MRPGSAMDVAVKGIEQFEPIPSGRRRTCRSCISAQRKARPGERERRQARHAKRDPAAERERLRLLAKRPDQRERKRRWTQQNAGRVNELARARRAAAPETHRRWSRENARRRRLGYNGESLAYADVLLADPCSYCDSPSEVVDHIAPIAKGGGNEPENLTGACGGCNIAKLDRPLLTFLVARLG